MNSSTMYNAIRVIRAVRAAISVFAFSLLFLVAGAAFGLKTTTRMKRFVFSFISVPFKWVKCGARKMLRLYTSNDAYLRLQV